jgi:hypothetical protein
MYIIGVCSMGALHFIFHNSAAGKYQFLISLDLSVKGQQLYQVIPNIVLRWKLITIVKRKTHGQAKSLW